MSVRQPEKWEKYEKKIVIYHMDKGHWKTVHSTKRWGRTRKKKKIVGDCLQFNDFDPWSVKNETHLKLFHAKHPLCSFISFIY